MQEIIKNKLILSVSALAIIGVIGASYTVMHSGPTIANAQASVVKSTIQGGQDKEVKDDIVSLKASQAAQEKADSNKNDKADSNGSNDGEDGN